MKNVVSMVTLVLLLGGIVIGCSLIETRKVEVNPYTLPETPMGKKFPVSAALVLDNGLKTYVIKHELVPPFPGSSATAAYQVGPHLERYATDVTSNMFQDIRVFDTIPEAAGKCDVVLAPKPVRSSTNITNPVQVMLVLEWQVMDGNGQNLLWLTSVESHASVTPGVFAHGKAQREAYTLVLSDLSLKTLQAFQNSPEVRNISTQSK